MHKGRVFTFYGDSEFAAIWDIVKTQCEQHEVSISKFLRDCVEISIKNEGVLWYGQFRKLAELNKAMLHNFLKQTSDAKKGLERVKKAVAQAQDRIDSQEEALNHISQNLLTHIQASMDLLRTIKNAEENPDAE